MTTSTPESQYLTRVFDEATTADINAEAAVKTVKACIEQFPVAGRRRGKRRQMIAAGMKANDIPLRWRALWLVASWLIPQPWSTIISAIIWAIDTYLQPVS